MTDDERWQGIAVYALYLIALFTGVPFLIGVILAYIFNGSATVQAQSHYDHQIGLFWRFVLGNIILWVVLGTGIALTSTVVFLIIGVPMIIGAALAFVWLWIVMLVRCIRGIGLINRNEPYPLPAGWGF